MKFIPKLLLKQLYSRGSLQNTASGVRFSIKNRLKDNRLVGIDGVKVAGQFFGPNEIVLDLGNNQTVKASQIDKIHFVDFPLRRSIDIIVPSKPLHEGKYEIVVIFVSEPFGKLEFSVEDAVKKESLTRVKIPRDGADDYQPDIIKTRQQFISEFSGFQPKHLTSYSFDPHILQGNCEQFVGVAQIPIGLAGPILINGEHAKGEFIIPLATTEGTLVASYNRGIKVLNECGGVKCTVMDDAMQRAPVFVFEDARASRHFVAWVKEHEKEIGAQAEATSSIAKLKYIDILTAGKFAYLRFNYLTGDAAGQNMVGRATYVACTWILDTYKDFQVTNFYLESNLATDKKASQINVMRTRGKRVVAEALIKRDVLITNMRVDPKQLAYHGLVANVGAFLSGANNNGLHSANAITAMFIATGQDVANVAESSAGVLYSELTDDGDLYLSITIPSLIVATYGGGTALATQRECLEILGCVGKGKVYKLAEIIAGVVLAGEISLASAISAADWVSSHEEYGRNR